MIETPEKPDPYREARPMPAKAPDPKIRARQKAARRAMRIVVRGEERFFRPADYGAADDVLVKHETKEAAKEIPGLERVSLMAALAQLDEHTMGLDSMCLIWWLAGRKAGDTRESLATAFRTFPTYGDLEAADDGEFVFELVEESDEEDDGSPED